MRPSSICTLSRRTALRRRDNHALTRIRTAIVDQPGQWAKVRRKLELEGDSLTRPPRGYDPKHPFIEDIKRKDFVASVGFSDRQVCGPAFMGDFAAACREISGRVEPRPVQRKDRRRLALAAGIVAA